MAGIVREGGGEGDWSSGSSIDEEEVGERGENWIEEGR